MGPRDEELLKKLLATFKVEAEEHLKNIASGLLTLERANSPEQQTELIESVFREAHSLKGAARSVNLRKVEAVCQSLESVFSKLKAQELSLSAELFDQLHETADAITALLVDDQSQSSTSEAAEQETTPSVHAGTNRSPSAHPGQISVPQMTPMRTELRPPADHSAQAQHSEQPQRLFESLRVPTSKLDLLLRQAEELIPTKATAAQRIAELSEISQALGLWDTEWKKVRPQVRSMEKFLKGKNGGDELRRSLNGATVAESRIARLVSFVDRSQNAARSLRGKLATVTKRLDSDRRTFERRLDELLADAKQVSTVPLSAFLEFLPKLVRDLCRDCGKDAGLSITGAEIEGDRRMLEEMKDPLIHLVRNCIDHGIETPHDRKKHRKSSRAVITIAISPKGNDKVDIAVSDDGAGIDTYRVRTAAIKLGIIAQEDAQKMTEQETAALIFKSGLSTSPIITEVSGRGLGLAIVREKVEKVGGAVSVETQSGRGATFRLILPLAIARFRGVIVRVTDRFLVVPTRHVQRVLRISQAEVRTVESRETIEVGGHPTSLVWLSDVLQLARPDTGSDAKQRRPVLVLGWGGERIAFLVDEILDEQEVLIKGLGKQLRHVRNISGATVLGTGKIIPVLSVTDLMQSAVNTAHSPVLYEGQEASKSILVAEDSITARTLLKNILEFAGYKVKTAVDGVDALTALADGNFDLVVSDVEMPRMGGFDLTEKIRADRKLADIPVILVTALESREHRERGVDVGANAYIVKSSFDQGNLLEVVRRLI